MKDCRPGSSRALAVRRAVLVVVSIVIAVLPASRAGAWTTKVAGENVSDAASSVALDPSGDLIAGGVLASPSSGSRVAAVKLAREDGHVLWESVVDAVHGSGRAVVDPAGDAILSGTVDLGPPTPGGNLSSTEMGPILRSPVGLAAVKLSGEDGSVLWRWIESGSDGRSIMGRTAVDSRGNLLANVWKKSTGGLQVVKLDGANGTPLWFGSTATVARIFYEAAHERAPLAVDDADDVVAAANDGLFGSREAAVVKLDGADGARRWSSPMPEGVGATALALDAHGDAIVGASSFYPPTGFSESRVVQKLVGATGAAVWTRELGPGDLNDVAIDDAGDVIVAGWAGGLRDAGTLSVVKLDGETGSMLWSIRASATRGIANAVTVDAAGDVFVAARLVVSGEGRFAILALRGRDGALRWTWADTSSGDAAFGARGIVLDGTGRAVGAGSLFGSEETLLDFAVVSLDAATGRDDACGSQRSCGSGPTLRVPTSGRGRLPQR